MGEDIKLPEPVAWIAEYGGDVYTADQLRAAVEADRVQRETAAEAVCYEAYQVVGSLLSDLGVFETEEARKILDNLSQAKQVHPDVLPWPSFELPARKPLTPEQLADKCEAWLQGGGASNIVDAYEAGVRFAERMHGVGEKP